MRAAFMANPDNQINVRFADYEKAAAESLAAAEGLTLSEHVRRAALRPL